MRRAAGWVAVVTGVLLGLASVGTAQAASFPDVEYAKPDGVSLQLDLETPDGDGPFPAVIFVHGGDFIAGNRKGTNQGLIAALKAEGIAWASVEYRMAPQYHFPVLKDDVETAVRFLKSHAKEYRLRPDRLAVMGESAGTLLVSQVGALATGDSRVAAVIGISGTHDLRRRFHPPGGCFIAAKFITNPEPGKPQLCLPTGIAAYLDLKGPGPEVEAAIKKASPRELIHKGMPPYLLVHGSADLNAPFEQSVLMYEALRAAGQPSDLLVIDGGGHGMGRWDAVPEQVGYRAKMVEWIKRTLTGK